LVTVVVCAPEFAMAADLSASAATAPGAVLTASAGLVWLRQDAQPETVSAVQARPATSAARAWER
jgi:hypothetical protein